MEKHTFPKSPGQACPGRYQGLRSSVVLAPFLYLFCATLGFATANTQPAERPNVIVICADALSAGKTGFEGHPVIKTPNLDKLAAESVYFSRTYVAVPQTTGSRVSLLTGRFPHSTRVMNETDPLPTEADSFTEELANAGYVCGLVGSWKLPEVKASTQSPEVVPDVPVAAPATSPATAPATSPATAPATTSAPDSAETPIPPRKLSKPGLGFDAYYAISDHSSPKEDAKMTSTSHQARPDKSGLVCVNGIEQPFDGYLPDWQTDRAIEFVRQAKGKPFCLCLFYRLPSEPLQYPPEMDGLYPPKSLPPKIPKAIHSKNLPPRLGSCGPVMSFQSHTDEQFRENQSKYYAMVTRLDQNVGRLMHLMEELRLSRNTLIVFTSAKGFPTGENGVWGTGPILWDPFIRCPLLVRMPGARPTTTSSAPASGPTDKNHRGGVKVVQMASLVDIAPTLLEAVGVKTSLVMHGHSLMPLLRGESIADWPNECFVENDLLNGQTFGSRALIAESFKFVDYFQEGDSTDQFFDLKRDPKEEWNLVNELDYSSLTKALKMRLERWRKRMRDTATQ